ncbi:MAG: lysylphosphatidylglycerol synthase transmembrane domain-containing protein [Chthoniobacteraceae bacterium]
MKKSALALFQITITALLLWWVFRDEGKRHALHDALHHADWWWLAAGVASYGMFEILAGIRWQILLRVQGVHLSWWRLYGLLMVGLFFSLFIPGGTGGDLIKGYYLLKEAPVGRKTSAALSVVMDRLLGLIGVGILTVVVTAFRWDWLMSVPFAKHCVYTVLGILAVAVSGMLLAGIVSGLRLVHALPEHLPGRNFLASVSGAYALYARAWFPTLCAIFISVLAHWAHYTTFWCASMSLEGSGPRKPSALELYSALPIIEGAAAIPLTPGGLGAREMLFDQMLTPLAGLEPNVAPTISVLGYLCIALWGAVGGVFYIFYRPSRAQRQAIRAETEAQFKGTPLG